MILENSRGRGRAKGESPPLLFIHYTFVHGGLCERDSSGQQDCVQSTHHLLEPKVRETGKEGMTLNLGLSPHQLRNDYMQRYASKVSEGMALQLGCLELRYVASRTLQGLELLASLDLPPGWEARVGT